MATRASTDGYRVEGKKGAGAVLALHAWWGLNPSFRQFCDALATEGWTVLAPDLYHGALATTVDEARNLRSRLKGDTVQRELRQALLELRPGVESSAVSVVGFSLGGYWGLWLAEQQDARLAAGVFYYASRGGEFLTDGPALQFHLAEADEYVALSGVKKMQKALRSTGRQAEFHTYPGTRHWFAEPDRPEYDRHATELAWSRTAEFLRSHAGDALATALGR